MEEVHCFKHPSNIIIAGPTGCGKTYFVHHVLEHRALDPMPERIVVVYAEWQPIYDQWRTWYPATEFINGFRPDLYDKFNRNDRNLLIIDDQMGIAGKSSELMDLFTRGSHHRNLTVIYLVQNIFDQGSAMRTVNLNAQYIVLFKNARDRMQLVTLGKQMFPEDPQYLSKLLDQETKRNPRAYVVVCTRPARRDSTRVYTGVFPDEETWFFPRDGIDLKPVYMVELG